MYKVTSKLLVKKELQLVIVPNGIGASQLLGQFQFIIPGFQINLNSKKQMLESFGYCGYYVKPLAPKLCLWPTQIFGGSYN